LVTAGVAPLQARRLSLWERARRLGRAEVITAGFAALLALVALGTALTKPAAERVTAEQHLQQQAQPIVERIFGAPTPSARTRAFADLSALLAHRDQGHPDLATAFTWAAVGLPVASALVLLVTARRKALEPP
jgi:hypothetical protein